MKVNNHTEILEELKFDAIRSLHPEEDIVSIEIIDLIRKFARHLNTKSPSVSTNYNLFGIEIEILILLFAAQGNELAPKDLILATGLTSGAMTAALNRLEKGKYIKRDKNNSDGRVLLAKLLISGKKLAERTIEERIRFTDNAMVNYDELERRQFRRLLKKLHELNP
ncbi:MAG: MarR family transcriptional regulator [Flavobacteriaceae bacterium]|nr:MarR family transcriptional regulator [Flavobacteriaceae bacterium]